MDKNYAAQDVIDSEGLNTYLDAEIYEAYAENIGHDIADLADWYAEAEEAYSGEYSSDEEFAQEFAEGIGALDTNAGWPNSCIDWSRAARDLMMDYFEEDGHYFRNI